jgi:hypothetical protein
MQALLAIKTILELIRLGVGTGLDVHAALGDLKQRIDEKGESFGWEDVLCFREKAEAAGVDAEAAIEEVYGPE